MNDAPAPEAPNSPPLAPTAEDVAYEAQAEKEREEIVQQDMLNEWRGVALEPWSERRSRLLDALCALDVPTPNLATCDEESFIHGSFPRSVKALYLLHHTPEHWKSLRPHLIEIIEEWGEEHVPANNLQEKINAVMFTQRIELAHRKLMVLRVPTTGARNPDAGN